MKNTIKINQPKINGGRIDYSFEVSGDWKEVFVIDEKFYIEYNINISSVPESVAIIPLLCNILPIAWVYDAEIYVDSCDKAFLDSIPDFKKGYEAMFSDVDFAGNIFVENTEQNNYSGENGAVTFFSGGVDAFNTLVNHTSENSALLTVWGADVSFEDVEGWNNVENHIKNTAKDFNLEFVTIKSSFRRFFNASLLTKKVYEKAKDNWWHGFQHGIGIIGHAAPVCYAMNKSTVYFASSFTAADIGNYTCASDPTIDNYVRFGSSHVIHDGYEFNRQAKVHNITEYSEKTGRKIPLRVCWKSTGGKNCCNCEKCWRTILALYAEKANPNEYGFDYSRQEFEIMVKKMKKCFEPQFSELRYRPIQEAMRKNLKAEQLPKELQWFYNMDIRKLGHHPCRRFIGVCKYKITCALKKFRK